MKSHNELRYKNRVARLKDFLSLENDAPPHTVARECLLIAGAVYDIPDLIDRVEILVGQPDEKLIQSRKDIEEYVVIDGQRRRIIPCPDGKPGCEVLHTEEIK